MKNTIQFLITMLCMILFIEVYAQDTTVIADSGNITVITTVTDSNASTQVVDVDNVLPPLPKWFDLGVPAVISFLTILFGYFSKWFPLLNKISSAKYRILAFAILLGAGWMKFGGADIWEVAIGYASATSLYELIFKEVIGSSWHVQEKLSKKQ